MDRIKEPEGLLSGVHLKVLVSEETSKPVTRIMKSLVRTGLRSLLRGVHLKGLVSEETSKPVTRIMKSLVRTGLRSLKASSVVSTSKFLSVNRPANL